MYLSIFMTYYMFGEVDRIEKSICLLIIVLVFGLIYCFANDSDVSINTSTDEIVIIW